MISKKGICRKPGLSLMLRKLRHRAWSVVCFVHSMAAIWLVQMWGVSKFDIFGHLRPKNILQRASHNSNRFQRNYHLEKNENKSKRLVLGPERGCERRLGGYPGLYNRVLEASLRSKQFSKQFCQLAAAVFGLLWRLQEGQNPPKIDFRK